jgi:hypothetical protein
MRKIKRQYHVDEIEIRHFDFCVKQQRCFFGRFFVVPATTIFVVVAFFVLLELDSPRMDHFCFGVFLVFVGKPRLHQKHFRMLIIST